MFKLFFVSWARFARLIVGGFWPRRGGGAKRSWRRVVTVQAFLLGLGIVQCIHWLGFLLDEILFPGYRKVEVREPLFILGVPRSGTTLLHRTLAEDERFTTFSTWECLFAPSITARMFWRAVGSLDRVIGGLLSKALSRLVALFLGGLDDVHAVDLDAAEEDYFALVPLWACFILFVPFPYAPWLRDVRYFDRDMTEAGRKRLLDYYEACLKKHLYVHRGKTLLSKNAAFASLADSLAERFPDARFVCCLRDPLAAAPSQLSSLAAGHRVFANESAAFNDALLDMLRYDYQHLADVFGSFGKERAAFVTMEHLQHDLERMVQALYRAFGIAWQPRFAEAMAKLTQASTTYRSAHRYALADFDLTETDIRTRFADAYARYDFAAEQPLRARRE